ncbi:MAG: hypothetical protein J5663_07330 [Bacteroidaceae bacterium]|nr:hypothetical protein [Bacteroidaceae bacterium]
MEKKIKLTLGRLFMCLLGLLCMQSCGKDEAPTIWIGDEGNRINCCYVIPEKLTSAHNCYFSDEVDDTINADLRLFVKGKASVIGHPYVGDEELEKRIIQTLDPNNERYGLALNSVDYTLKTCQSITISLYDKDSVFVADVTDKARFYYIYVKNEDYYQMLINSDKEVLGQIRMGMSIKEYLACKPLVFVAAHFIFDGLEKSEVSGGKFFRTKIVLDDGMVLESDSKEQKF